MSTPVYTYRRSPALYRLARALRVLSAVVLVLLILFTVSVVYSTAQLSHDPPQVGSFSAGFDTNATMILAGSLTLSNPGYYPIDGLTLVAKVDNATGGYLGAFAFGPESLSGQTTDQIPINLYLPVSATGAGASLLTHSQILQVALWGNATFGYLFPAGIALNQSRSWGAPFDHLNVSVGEPTPNGSLPVTISFENQASLAEQGSLSTAVVASDGISCGSAGWTLNVATGQSFSQTQDIALTPGCSPAGGSVVSAYVTTGYTVPLPPEAIP